ncbi:MAG: glycosyltransferase [Candidatus Bathyarchaeia archaeon]
MKLRVLTDKYPDNWTTTRHLNFLRAFQEKGVTAGFHVFGFKRVDIAHQISELLTFGSGRAYWCFAPQYVPYAKSPCFVDLDTADISDSLRAERRRLNNGKIKALVTGSEIARQYLITKVGVKSKIEVVSTGLDLKRFRPRPAGKYGLDVGFVGNLNTDLYKTLLGVMKNVWEAKPSARLVLFGRGINIDDIRQDTRVVYFGYRPNETLPDYLAFLDVCLGGFNPGERVPLKLLEYMACARPIVAMRLPGNNLVEDAGAGILCEPAEIGKTVVTLLEDSATRKKLGDGGRAYVEKNHDVSNLADQYLQILSKNV